MTEAMTAKQRKLLEWLGRVDGNILLETQVVGSGLDRALNELLRAGKVEMTAHPTVKDGKAPAAAVVLKIALASSQGTDNEKAKLANRV